ncbi:MAG: undecaprenyl-diphosphate phosphatase [Lachnospiraceae bacterium]|nr:undecaprenyl-diphosphate phosphatase [Lachnospiraceae bacterium]
MTVLQSIFLGIVQGLTEFLPVSSSGHLAIFQNIFHIDTGSSILYDILLHVGTLLVVLIVYWKDIWKLILEFFGMVADIFRNIRIWFENRNAITLTPYKNIVGTNYRKFVILLIVSTIPTGIIGVLGKKLIADASATLIIPGICLIITGILLLISDRAENCVKIPKDVSYKEGVIIGIAQGFATLPGLSRSGTTITACLLCGLNRSFAVKYSFILSIPAILGAAVFEIGDAAAETITAGMVGTYLAGMIAAAIVGYVCIRTMLVIVRKRKFKYFAFYCFAIGIVSIIGQFFMK